MKETDENSSKYGVRLPLWILEAIQESGRKNAGIQSLDPGRVIRARFHGGTPDFTFARRATPGLRINPGESYDSGFIHAGALVHAPE